MCGERLARYAEKLAARFSLPIFLVKLVVSFPLCDGKAYQWHRVDIRCIYLTFVVVPMEDEFYRNLDFVSSIMN